MKNALAHRFYVSKSIASEALLHLGEEGGNLHELLQPEEAIPDLVLKQHEVGDHCGKPRRNLQLQIISEKVPQLANDKESLKTICYKKCNFI